MRRRPLGSATCDAWPWWFAPVGVLSAFAATGLAAAVVVGIATASTSIDADAPGVALALTALQDGAFILTAVLFAAAGGGLSAAALGLRSVGRRRLAVSIAGGLAGFLAFAAAWTALTGQTGEQETLKSLGTDENTINLVLTALLVVGVAPVAEELLFRGLAYRALRNAMAPAIAAAVIGIGFGAIHYSGPDSAGVIVPLAVLGALFCLLYEWTGSLWPSIGLHVANNALALAVTSDRAGAPLASASVGLVMLAGVAALSSRPEGRS